MHRMLGELKGQFNAEKSFIDNVTFRLHYRITFVILLASSILATASQFFGFPIKCEGVGSIRKDLLDVFCWMHGTFTVPAPLAGNVGQDMPHMGIGPSNDPTLIKVKENGEELHHAWYQWVCFVLFLQAILCFFPHYLWKIWEGGKVGMLLQDLHGPILDDPTTKTKSLTASAKYFVRNLHSNGGYAAKFVFCEALNLVNILLQVYLMDAFLGHHFTTYGLEAIKPCNEPFDQRVDALSKIFPKVTKCTFNNYGASGSVEMKDMMCVLGFNVINEKIYIFLWYWYLVLIVCTCLQLVLRIVTIASSNFRAIVIKVIQHKGHSSSQPLSENGKKLASKKYKIDSLIRLCDFGDWLILMQVSKHFEPEMFNEFVAIIKSCLNNSRKMVMLTDNDMNTSLL